MSVTDPEPIYQVDLDEEFLAHLANHDSWNTFLGEEFSADLLQDEFVANVFLFQLDHDRKYGKPASPSILEETFDYEVIAPVSAAGDLIERLRDRYARGQQRDKLKEIVKLQHSDPLQVAGALLLAGRELTELLTPKGETFGTGDFTRAKHRYDLKVSRGKGPSFGHQMLDDYFYGMSGLTFWIAPPKRYKSWQMIQGVVGNVRNGVCTHLYSLELPSEETDMRLRCMLAGVPWWHYTRNCTTNHEWQLIEEESKVLDGEGIYKIIKPPAGKRSMDDMFHRSADAGAQAIFFDQLQYIEASDNASLGEHNKTGEYWKVLNRARDLSDEIPLCIAHQFNRDTMYADSMPMVQQAKGSSAIEETATLALGMWANKDMMRSQVIEIGMLIARNHMFQSWEMDVELSSSCSFSISRKIEDE
jgi:hypothetical protein